MKSFTAKHRGFCGHCAKSFPIGANIVRLETPRRLRLPGRYGDMDRPRIVSASYAHTDCEKEIA